MDERQRARQSLERLLAERDHLTRDEKAKIFESVIKHQDVRRGTIKARVYWLGFGAALATALLFMVSRAPDDTLTPRGGKEGSEFSIQCRDGGQAVPCRRGALLSFVLHPATDMRYFAAYARDSSGAVIWYFPEDEVSPGLATTPSIAERGIFIGAEHQPGRFRVAGVFSKDPMTRAQIRALVEQDKASLVEHEIEVAPERP